jgi:hypothetical protein
MQDNGSAYASNAQFNCVFQIFDKDTEELGAQVSLVKTIISGTNTFEVTASELLDEFVDDDMLVDSVWKISVTNRANSADSVTTYLVICGSIENEIYRRIRANVNNERIQPSSYNETLYMYTMLKSLTILSSLADNEQIVRILNMLKAITVMSKYCSYDVQYINE